MKSTFSILIEDVKKNWTTPKEIQNISSDLVFRCQFFHGIDISKENIFPNDFIEFYRVANGAYLFEDVYFGQWGLQLLDFFLINYKTAQFIEENNNYINGDCIIGEFLGDSELLLLRLDKSKDDYGRILIVNPITEREDWYEVESSFSLFVGNYIKNLGGKYWE